jgi:arylsulfatase
MSGRQTKDVWELYNLEEDWSQANDLAAKMPEKLARLKDPFLIEATKNKALPIGGGLWVPVLHPEMRIAPPYTEWTFSGDTVRMPGVLRATSGQQTQHRQH